MLITRIKSILRILFLITCGCVFPCSAASFLPTSEEFQSFSPANKRAINSEIATILAVIPPEEEEFLIDDMAFRTADLRKRSAFIGQKWSGGRVYYKFDSDVTNQNRERFRNAAATWTSISNLQFIESSTQQNYINVVNANVNSSFVGMIGGAQKLKIANWSYKYVIAHEIGHALGLTHEHQRSDRGNYVQILFENIIDGAANNFKKNSSTNYGPYDFESVMHYGKTFFSKDRNTLNTIEPLPPYWEYLNVMGNQDHLTKLDKDGMAARYGAPLQGEGDPIKITASNCQIELIDTENNGIITLLISNETQKASVKIAHLSKLPSNPKQIPGKVIYHKITTIELTESTGSLAKILTDTDITTLSIQGDLLSLTTKNAVIPTISATGSIGKIKMAGQSDTSGASAIYLNTRIFSDKTADSPMKVALTGIVLTHLETEQTVALLTATSKKFKNKTTKRVGVSQGGLGRIAPEATADTLSSYSLLAESFGRIRTKGASILPDTIQSSPSGDITALLASKSATLNGALFEGTIGTPGNPENLQVFLPGIKSISGDAGVSGIFIAGFDTDGPTYEGTIKKITSKKGQVEGQAHVSPNLPEPKIKPDDGMLLLHFTLQP